MQVNKDIRNIAIIAHVDHGKTTLVDHLFKQSGLFRDNQEVKDRTMDNMDLERERGITISAKNCSVVYDDIKINILDTPGHADFGGEVERALMMVDGAILLVDAAEGPLPQTRFVIQKSLELGLGIIVVINKIDRKDARAEEVLNEIYDLFIDLDAEEDQLDFPVLYAVARDGIAKTSLDGESENLDPLFKSIVDTIPAPKYETDEGFQMLVANISYSEYLGSLAIGRITNGKVGPGDKLKIIGSDNNPRNLKVSDIQVYSGIDLKKIEADTYPGEIVILSGVDAVEIGDTICDAETTEALPRIKVDEPTVSMRFMPNTSPLAGQEGKIVQPQKIGERLKKEALYNVALEFEENSNGEYFTVKARGELQLAILIEQMRREDFELTVGRPEILFKEENGKKTEPIEHVFIDCNEEHLGTISEKLSSKKGKMVNLINNGSGRVRVEFSIPSRALIGFRSEFLTDTKGTGMMNSYLEGYEEYRGDFESRRTGSLVSDRSGEAVAFGLYYLEPRGSLLVTPGQPVYEGMIVGEHNRPNDLNVNPCKSKKLSNMRASGKDEQIQLTSVKALSLEESIEFIREDEQVEVTPTSIRLRKAKLRAQDRKDRL
ncbi:UNVERIFIED_CONTAM: hypothetical protein GTU68_021648 [Idotea baltica]|nr:hypothetical protein [Idotea baltica]